MSSYNYSISAQTLNGTLASRKLLNTISSSSITKNALHVNTDGDTMYVVFDSNLTSEEETTLGNIVAAHDGIPEPENIQPSRFETYPFSSKVLSDGKKLYAREHGISPVVVSAGQTQSIEFTIPYASCKITGAEMVGTKFGDTCNFKILDTITGAVTTIPKYTLNQFGHNVNMSEGSYKKEYSYDADLFMGLIVCVEYTNNGSEDITVAINLDLHEVK